jgi:iron complex transport system ATP-binding protein
VALFKLLKKLTKETNKCILFSTHDIDMAIQLSDEMIIMTPKLLFKMNLVILFPKERSILFKDEHIILIQIKGSL